MKTPFILILFTSLALALVGCGKKDPSAVGAVKPARETSFAEVTGQLDPGGSVYGYLSTEQWLAGLSTNVAQLGELAASFPNQSGIEGERVQRVIGLVARIIRTSGLESLNGIGVSGIQITPELHRTKLVLHHGKGRGDGVLWNVMGSRPHALDGLDLLPANTGLAFFGDLDFQMLWTTVERELRDVPELAEALRKWPQTFEQQTQLSWSKLMASLGGELGFVLTLDDSRKMTLPIGDPLEIPEPGLLVVVKVNDELLYNRLSEELQKSGEAQVTDENGLKLSSMRMPVPLPIDLQITVASSDGYLFLASSPALVREVLNVRAGKSDGLRKSPEFAELMKYLPSSGNQFAYVDRRLSEAIRSVQEAALSQGEMDPAQSALIRRLFLSKAASFGMSISAHTETGWQSVTVGNEDSATALIAAPALGVAAVGSAMLLPALSNAKGRAQSINCINNMKQIGLAFRIWSLDNEDRFPFNVSTASGGTLELCDRASDGYDAMSYRHFQVMSNELSTPKILVCPDDSSKHVASNFEELQPENVSYLVRSGKDVDETRPDEILTYCPVHHHIGYADGSVHKGTQD